MITKFDEACNKILTEMAVYMRGGDRPGELDHIGYDMDEDGATKYARARKRKPRSHEEAQQLVNNLAVDLYDVLMAAASETGEVRNDAGEEMKYSDIQRLYTHLGQKYNLDSANTKYILRVIVNKMRKSGIIMSKLPKDKAVDAISSGVKQAIQQEPEIMDNMVDDEPEKKKTGFFSKLFNK